MSDSVFEKIPALPEDDIKEIINYSYYFNNLLESYNSNIRRRNERYIAILFSFSALLSTAIGLIIPQLDSSKTKPATKWVWYSIIFVQSLALVITLFVLLWSEVIERNIPRTPIYNNFITLIDKKEYAPKGTLLKYLKKHIEENSSENKSYKDRMKKYLIVLTTIFSTLTIHFLVLVGIVVGQIT